MRKLVRTWAAVHAVALGSLATAASAAAQEVEEEDPSRSRFEISVEGKANFRSSDDAQFKSPFGFPPDFRPPGGGDVFFGVVDPGDHLELSAVTVILDGHLGDSIDAHVKIDAIDLYDRNPTSGDKIVDVDEAWIRFGRETPAGAWPERGALYAKVGKMAKFERQNDRHLESYGLVSTAFNRFEDLGLELGADLGRHVYLRLSATQGNPLFMRDPNALAGDNGTDDLRQPNPVPALGSGITILYDAEVEDLDSDGDLELGAGLGVRLGDPEAGFLIDVMGWYYERTLADRVELEGTFYGGDLDLLDGPDPVAVPSASLPIAGDQKSELGANLRVHWHGLSVFGQYVDQEVAGLERIGYEAELAWRFDLPLVWATSGGKQLFPTLQPAVRFSRLEPDFPATPSSAQFPAPSLGWEWDKVDYGLRIGIVQGIDLTVEFADNTFLTKAGKRSADEFLATLRFRF